LLLLSLGLVLALPAGAHHSGAAYDRDKAVTVNGTVSSVEWTSPHAWIKVDAKNETGGTVTWEFELPSPVTLTRRGWARSALVPGDKVTVTGAPAREHPHIAIATAVIDKNGRRLFGGAASSTE
jgi:DNA/RNA endonuclease YhcR with UshA esterase domain